MVTTGSLQFQYNGQKVQLPLEENPKYTNPMGQHVEDYFKKTDGAYRLFLLIRQVTEAIALVFLRIDQRLSKECFALSKKFGAGCSLFSVTRLTSVTRSMRKALVGEKEFVVDAPFRRGGEFIATVCDFSSTWLYASSLIFAAPIRHIADMFSITYDCVKFQAAIEDYNIAGEVEKIAHGEMEKAQKETKKEALIRVMKLSAKIATRCLASLVLMLGGPAIPAFYVLVGLSLPTSVLSIGNHFYKEAYMEYKPCSPLSVEKPPTDEKIA